MATAVDYGRMYTPTNMPGGYLNQGTRIGDEVVTQGLASDLEAFYNKTDCSLDKTKALELLSSLRLGEAQREEHIPRPHTAMPTFGYRSNPYVTSYQRDYPLKEQPFTGATRPMTSHGFRGSRKVGKTTYTEEFNEKPNRPPSPVRSGSSSGNRANNPHPTEAFMVWRFPSKSKQDSEGSPWSEKVTDDAMNQVHKRLCQSTYQTDYLGIPQGFQLKSAYTLPPDWKADIPYTLDSVARYSYQKPMEQDELKLPVSRYGSNKKKHIAVDGTIPTASSRFNHIKQRTTYDRHYNDNTGPVVQQIKDVSRKLEAEALKKYYEKAAPEDKDVLKRMLEVYRVDDIPVSNHVPTPPSFRPQSRMSIRSSGTPVSSQKNSQRPPSSNRKISSRIACTPITDFEHVNTTYTRPVQVQMPMQVPKPETPLSVPFTPTQFLS